MAWSLLYDKAKALSATSVLADGVTVYMPGLSSRKNGASEFRHGDLLGSLRFLTDANQNVVGDRLFSAFGATVAFDGDPSTPFGWVGDGESQTDADTGLVLMGHRVYDSRLGRFLSQDPAGAGDNWYSYCDNNPINKADPSGNVAQTVNGGSASIGGPGYLDAVSSASLGTLDDALDDATDTYMAADAYNAAWAEATTLADGAQVVSTDTSVSGEDMDGMMFAAGHGQSSVTTPEGAEAVAQLQEDGIAVGKPGDPLRLAKEDLKSIRSHVKRIEEHITKMRQYKSDPLSMENEGTLTNPNNAQNVGKIIQGRIDVLEKTIQKHFGEIIKILNRG